MRPRFLRPFFLAAIFSLANTTSSWAQETVTQERIRALCVDLEEKAGPDRQIEAINELKKIGKPAVMPLLDQLGHDQMATVGRSAKALEAILKEPQNRTADARKKLKELAKLKGYGTPSNAVQLLGLFEEADAMEGVEEVARGHSSDEVRAIAVSVLSKSGKSNGHKKLYKDLLKDESPTVAARAARSLARIKDDSGREVALRILVAETKGTTARRSSVDTLVDLKDSRDLPAMEAAYEKNPDWYLYRGIQLLKYAQISTEDGRRDFLAKALKDNSGRIYLWAAVEIQKKAVADPIYKQLLESAAQDKTHPHRSIASACLEALKRGEKKK